MTLDPLSELAHKDDSKLLELMDNANVENDSIKELLSIISRSENTEIIDDTNDIDDFDEYDEHIETKNICPKCKFEWS
jgi:predicted Zn-ribbon and HTH transcriptional regulator